MYNTGYIYTSSLFYQAIKLSEYGELVKLSPNFPTSSLSWISALSLAVQALDICRIS